MMLKKIGRMISGISLSAVLCLGSVGETFGGMYVVAAGEENAAEEEMSVPGNEAGEEALTEAVSDNDEEASGIINEEENGSGDEAEPEEGEAVSENEVSDSEETASEDSVSANDTVSGNETPDDGGGSGSDDEYPYTDPCSDPAYKDNAVWISAIYDNDFFYSKAEYKPHPFVFYDDEMLVEGRDYTLSWKNNINAYSCEDKEEPTQTDFDNAPQVILNMKGSYSGSTRAFFNIQPRSILWYEIESADTVMVYTGKKVDYTPVVTWNGEKLKEGRDFKFGVYDKESGEFRAMNDKELTDVTDEADPIYVIIRGIGNYNLEREAGFRIIQKENAANVSGLKVSAIPDQQYTGSPILPENFLKKGKPFEITVTDGKTQLVRGVDYTIEPLYNVIEPGIYNLTIKGMETPGTNGVSYVGTKTVQFKVVCDIKNAQVTGVAAEYSVKGGERCVRPDESNVHLKIGDSEIPAFAYDISYKKDNKAGKASMIFTGKDGFTGKKVVQYRINAVDISNTDITVTDAEYMKKGAKAYVYVEYQGDSLINDTDYKLSYKNNKQYQGSKTPKVIIQGKGLYKGKAEREFKILKNAFDENFLTVTVKDKVASSKAGGYISKVTVTDSEGAKLTAGKDYEKDVVYKKADGTVLTKQDTVNAGETITVVITGKGAYDDTSISAEYHIIDKGYDISKAKVKIADQYYKAGYKVYIPLDDTSISVTMGGTTLHRVFNGTFVDDTLSGDIDGFELVSGSYKKNNKCGTASVMLHGVGKYGGFKTVKFKIKPVAVKGVKPSKKIPVPDKYLLVTDFGAIPDDNIDDTDAIYNAICAASNDTENDHNLYFPEGKYNVGKGSSFSEVYINMPNVNMVLHSNAVLFEAVRPGDGYNAIHIKADNVSIRGGMLQGERFRHSGGSVGQYGMGIAIDKGKNISIRDMTICDNRGDGIYINDGGHTTVSNVTIKNCDIYDNSRNNIGVIRGDKITIEGCHIYHEKDGFSPMAGIDLEPDGVGDNYYIHNVLIKDCKIETYQHKSATEVKGYWTYFGILIIAGCERPVVFDVTIQNCDIYGDLCLGSGSNVKYPGTTVHGDIIPSDF